MTETESVSFTILWAESLVGPQSWLPGNLNPFVKVVFGGASVQTSSKRNTLNPLFNEQLELRSREKSVKALEVAVYDQVAWGLSNLVGEGTVPRALLGLCGPTGPPLEHWVKLSRGGEPVGKVFVRVEHVILGDAPPASGASNGAGPREKPPSPVAINKSQEQRRKIEVEMKPGITAKKEIKDGSKKSLLQSCVAIFVGILLVDKKFSRKRVYSVKAGDTLSTIAEKYNTTTTALLAKNRDLSDRNTIYYGYEICI
mmetsp:Transcript_13371/g.18272  ORF Transcript_13371/g.18272 Transcript_13371/m.18272 type:complete len:256 (+) Transcript_13371:63-830(+)|eukprot:CAMPEP_0196592818 /NCGR_PEP_ID=MMETSP1081-20130531/73892_1 /TAXON_ID=36882 /ORGANISM="Pyramimonas amylifera, Strain CCMP720" /LENGTH=255 /DNA_ID=CAMNT_0041916623 /DNA_START=61 /DNA_END=828 /DNA_ORIENTATION=+